MYEFNIKALEYFQKMPMCLSRMIIYIKANS